ncbi:hypothetical protein [Gilliamella apicola]|uniref:hypothetical protein n=1 Tax=Gilliamella apicola TaxID=1196095 RepID=UPI002FEDF329
MGHSNGVDYNVTPILHQNIIPVVAAVGVPFDNQSLSYHKTYTPHSIQSPPEPSLTMVMTDFLKLD